VITAVVVEGRSQSEVAPRLRRLTALHKPVGAPSGRSVRRRGRASSAGFGLPANFSGRWVSTWGRRDRSRSWHSLPDSRSRVGVRRRPSARSRSSLIVTRPNRRVGAARSHPSSRREQFLLAEPVTSHHLSVGYSRLAGQRSGPHTCRWFLLARAVASTETIGIGQAREARCRAPGAAGGEEEPIRGA